MQLKQTNVACILEVYVCPDICPEAFSRSFDTIIRVYLDLRQLLTWEQHVANQELHQRRLRINYVKSSGKRCRSVKERSRL
jgi:hypothetical protein